MEYNNGLLLMTQTEKQMNMLEDLQLELIEKSSYGLSKVKNFHIQISKQCKLKGDYNIGLLRNRHLLRQFNLMEDFVNMFLKDVYYITVKDGVVYQRDHSVMMQNLN